LYSTFYQNFKITVEEAGNNTYPGCGITMRTWNDHIQYQMLLEALDLNNNSLVGLPADYFRSNYHVLEYSSFVGLGNGCTPALDQNLFSNDITIFLLGIPFAADSSHMEGKARARTDINWTIHGGTVGNPLIGNVGG
jgi:hypothetical protein